MTSLLIYRAGGHLDPSEIEAYKHQVTERERRRRGCGNFDHVSPFYLPLVILAKASRISCQSADAALSRVARLPVDDLARARRSSVARRSRRRRGRGR